MKTCPKCFTECADETRFCPSCGEGVTGVDPEQEGTLTGKTIAGNFLLQEMIGSGAMGAIYKAEQISLGKIVAIKLLHRHLLSDPTLSKRFHREARAASKLNHPNCISIIDFGQAENGALFIAMEFIDGMDLAELVFREYPLGAERIIRILKQVCVALDEAHAQTIIHRDLKPENIMIEERRTERDFVKVLDFGIAKLQDPQRDVKVSFQTVAGVVCGTPEYMSPEQARGESLDARSDLYSLGIILYQLLTNQLPFTGESPIGVVTKHLTEPVPSPRKAAADVDPDLDALCMRLMAKHREKRPSTAMELFRELERIEKRLATANGPTRGTLVAGGGVIAGARRPDPSDAVTGEEITAIGVAAMPDEPAAERPAPRARHVSDPPGSPAGGAHDNETQVFSTSPHGVRPVRSLKQRQASAPAPVGTEIGLEAVTPRRKSGAVGLWVAASLVVAAAGAFFVWRAVSGPTASEAASAPAAERSVRPSPDDPGAASGEPTPPAPSEPVADKPETPPAAHSEPKTPTPLVPKIASPEPLVPKVEPAVEAPIPEPKVETPTVVPVKPLVPEVTVDPVKPDKVKPDKVKPEKTAKPDQAEKAAQLAELLAKAKEATQASDWSRVILAYNGALKIQKRPNFYKEIGHAFRKLGKMDLACASYQKYLNALPARERTDALERLASFGCPNLKL